MSNPARLWKDSYQTNHNNLNEKLEAWAYAHAVPLLLLFCFLAGVIFVILCYQLVGISAVESGAMRNFANSGAI